MMASKETITRVLFLTTYPVTGDSSQRHNFAICDELRRQGVATDIISWREPKVTIDQLCQYSHVSFVTCLNYIHYIEAFHEFLRKICIEALQRNPSPVFLNSPTVTLWNSNKIYLNDLQTAGFCVPKTLFLSTLQPIDYIKFALASRTSPEPVIVKPSVSSDGRSTHLIRHPKALTTEDETFLLTLYKQPSSGSIIVQEFLPAVYRGEYSLTFIGGAYRYTYLKIPAKNEYRVQQRFGGIQRLLDDDDVPSVALAAGRELCTFVERKFDLKDSLAYARVDGVVDENGQFVLMELELIEPALGIHRGDDGNTGVADMCQLFKAVQ